MKRCERLVDQVRGSRGICCCLSPFSDVWRYCITFRFVDFFSENPRDWRNVSGASRSVIFNRNHDCESSRCSDRCCRWRPLAEAAGCLLWAGPVAAAALLPFIIVDGGLRTRTPSVPRSCGRSVADRNSEGRCKHASAPPGLSEAWLAVGSPPTARQGGTPEPLYVKLQGQTQILFRSRKKNEKFRRKNEN